MKPRWVLVIAAAITIGIAGVASAVAIGTRDVSDHDSTGGTGAPPLASRTTGGGDRSESAPSQVRNIRLTSTNGSEFTIEWNAGDTDVTSLYEVSLQGGPTKRVGVGKFSYPWLDAKRVSLKVWAISASGVYSSPASLTITPSTVPQNRPDDTAPQPRPSGGAGDGAGSGAAPTSSHPGKTSTRNPGDGSSRDEPTSNEPSSGAGHGSGSGTEPDTPSRPGGSGSGGTGGSGSGGTGGSGSGTPTPSKTPGDTPSGTPTPSDTPSSPTVSPTDPTPAPTSTSGSGDAPASDESGGKETGTTPSQPDRYPGPTSGSPTGNAPATSPRSGDRSSAPA